MIPKQRQPADAAEPPYTPAVLAAAIAGDRQAFGELYRAHHDAVHRFVYYRVSTRALADDLVSDTFVAALRNIGTFADRSGTGGFPAWLITIARNQIADHFKRSSVRCEISTADMLDHDPAVPGPEADVIADLTNHALSEALHDALVRLIPRQRECLSLRFLDNLAVSATSARMGIAEGAAKTLQYRAVRTMGRDDVLIGAINAVTDPTQTWSVALPAGYRPTADRGLFACGANARLHPMVRYRVTREIRGAAKIAARGAGIPAMTGPVSILAVQHPALGARGLDADNIAPLVKPMIDGLRDAGVLADDSRAYVTEVRYTVGGRRPGSQLVLHLTPAPERPTP